MNLNEIIFGGSGIAVIILTIMQVTPIKINPWSKIARSIGKALTVDVLDKLDENKADTSRYRILRFDDEIRHKTKHTEEHFNQILDDIDTYERYCRDHPDYKNSKAVFAIDNIRQTHKRCRDEGSFLI